MDLTDLNRFLIIFESEQEGLCDVMIPKSSPHHPGPLITHAMSLNKKQFPSCPHSSVSTRLVLPTGQDSGTGGL